MRETPAAATSRTPPTKPNTFPVRGWFADTIAEPSVHLLQRTGRRGGPSHYLVVVFVGLPVLLLMTTFFPRLVWQTLREEIRKRSR